MKFVSRFLYIFPSNATILIPWFVSFVLISLLDVFGIGIVGPFIALASNPSIIQSTLWLSRIYNWIGFVNINRFTAIIGILIIIIFCTKSFISWYVQSHIFKFSYIQREKLIAKLMHAYLEAPYTIHINKNSAQIIQNVLNLTSIFSDRILSTLLTSTSNLVSILAISILLCLVSPFAVLSLFFLIIPTFFLLSSFKSRVKQWGKELHEAEQGVIRNVNHALGGFKETRVIGCGPFFEQETIKQAHRFAEAAIQFYAFQLSPRFIIEALLIIFVIGFTSTSLLLNQNIQQLTSTLGVFALASIRLIPAFTGLVNGINTIRNGSYAFNQLYLDLKELEDTKTANVPEQLHSSMTTQSSIQNLAERVHPFVKDIVLDAVTYHYPTATSDALSQLSITIPKGQSIALIGRSGAGKTTLVDVLLGLLVPQKGDIRVDGISIYENLRSWQNMIGYIPQSIFLIDDTVERNIAFGVPDHLIDPGRLEKAIRAAQLAEVVENLPEGIRTRVGERGVMLSGGQRQRVGIARALYHEREILVLDEATSALDNETENLVTEAIKSLSGTKTMIIIAHRLTTVEHCDRIYLMEKGQVMQSGSYQEVVLERKMLH